MLALLAVTVKPLMTRAGSGVECGVMGDKGEVVPSTMTAEAEGAMDMMCLEISPETVIAEPLALGESFTTRFGAFIKRVAGGEAAP